jgi:hypothetical protein
MVDIILSDGTKLNDYLATTIAEGFCEGTEYQNEDDILKAWSYLIKTGLCYKLQGWFGRSANNLIQSGLIDQNGNITK